MQEVQQEQFTGFWSGEAKVVMFTNVEPEQILVFKSHQAFREAELDY